MSLACDAGIISPLFGRKSPDPASQAFFDFPGRQKSEDIR